MPTLWLPCLENNRRPALWLEQNTTSIQCTASKRKRNEWTWYWSSGRSQRTNSGICQCVEESQEEDAVKEQCRCNPTKQERTGQTQCLLSTLGTWGCHGVSMISSGSFYSRRSLSSLTGSVGQFEIKCEVRKAMLDSESKQGRQRGRQVKQGRQRGRHFLLLYNSEHSWKKHRCRHIF